MPVHPPDSRLRCFQRGGDQSGAANSNLPNSKPGATVQPTSVQSPVLSAACQACVRHHGLRHFAGGQIWADPDRYAGHRHRRCAASARGLRNNARSPPRRCGANASVRRAPAGNQSRWRIRVRSASDVEIAKRLAIMAAFRMRDEPKLRDDVGGGRRCFHQDLFLRSRNSPNTSAALAPFIRRLAATDGSSARRKTLACFSLPSCHRKGRLARGAQTRHLLGARLQRGIVRFDRQRELDVGSGIFMAAIKPEVVRQRAQLQQQIPHHEDSCLQTPARSRSRTACRRRTAPFHCRTRS